MCRNIYILSYVTLFFALAGRYRDGRSSMFDAAIDYVVAGLVITFTYHVARILAQHERR